MCYIVKEITWKIVNLSIQTQNAKFCGLGIYAFFSLGRGANVFQNVVIFNMFFFYIGKMDLRYRKYLKILVYFLNKTDIFKFKNI